MRRQKKITEKPVSEHERAGFITEKRYAV